ncbi:MAG: S8 family serine peptidase, partial [Cyanobacteria bacterium P01_A01_bin.135]
MSNPFSLGSFPPEQPANAADWAQQLAVPVSGEGATLQRGGERLALHKAGDRFTVSAANLPQVQPPVVPPIAQVGGTVTHIMPLVSLAAVQVPPEQLDPAMDQLRRQDEVAFASHVYQLDEGAQEFYLTDQITVQFTPETTLADIEAIAAAAGLRRLEPIDGVANAHVFQVTAAAPVNPLKLANRLSQLVPVLLAEPNVAVSTQGFHRPRDPLYGDQWYLQHRGGRSLAANSHISVEAAWDITRGRRSVVVAIIDDGFDLGHPDLSGPGKLVAPRDFQQRDGVPLPEQTGENHGTAVAGVAIAEENGEGIVGVAPGCALMPIRYSGVIDDQSIEALFRWATDHGAAVISCSWGAVGTRYALSLRQRAAITRAATQGRDGKGCVVLFAAGNANRPVDGTVNEQGWPSGALRGGVQWLNGFAVHPDVIAVSACTSLNQKSAYSN